MYALQVSSYRDESRTRTSLAFEAYPWKGGWSAVDFYERLRRATPARHRPRIVSIQFSSPGFIELLLLVPVSAAIRVVVNNTCHSFERISAAYTVFHRDAAERKLLRIDARNAEQRIGRRDREFCEYDMLALLCVNGVRPATALRPASARSHLPTIDWW